MIPRILQLKNFLSYGADLQTIDFTPHHLIYLSGRNGHGKSALLDAMTWAIWGQARKVTNAVRADQGLIRLGQTQMAVIFDFEVNGQLYRVKREFLKTHNKPLVQLEFGVLQEGGEFVPLTDKTIRATQAKIEKTIKLDYDSFINTAFLRQGNANEFSKKSPKERKEIIGTILGLQEFDQLKKRALEKIKALQAQRTALATVQESIDKQLEEKETIEKEWLAIQKERDAFLIKEKEYAKEKETLDKKKEALQLQQKQKEIAQFKMQEHQKKVEQEKELVASEVKSWRSVHKKQRSMPSMDNIEKQHEEKKKKLSQWDSFFKQSLELEQKKIAVIKAVDQRKSVLEAKLQATRQENTLKKERLLIERDNLTKQTQKVSLELQALSKKEDELKKKDSELAKQLLSDEKLQAMQKVFDKRKEKYHQFIAWRNMLQTTQQSLIQRQQMVQDENPSCPLCEQNLSAARKKFLKNKSSKEERLATHQYNRLALATPKLKELLINQHTYLDEQKKIKDAFELLQKEMKKLSHEVKEITAQLQSDQKLLKTTLSEIEIVEKKSTTFEKEAKEQIEKDEQIQKLSLEQTEINKSAASLKYSEKEHEKVRNEFEKVEKERAAFFMLQQDIIKQLERKESIARRIQSLKKLKQELSAQEKELEAFKHVAADQKKYGEQEQEFGTSQKKYREDREALREKWGALVQKRKQLEKLEQETKVHEKEVKLLDLEIADYQDIAVAAGKDGIQALLIEDAIPEIEQEANQLLSRLTHNQSQILIESLRDLKRGGSKETLDINISDPSGIRPYELFSGGEAFRIDFALRIAISKLLARRAGTSLQTLIIDEGFGSQDEDGLSLIMDTLYKVQDDFEKVIVVSHLPSMKDQFPVHFNVEKGPSGSRISIIEQG